MSDFDAPESPEVAPPVSPPVPATPEKPVPPEVTPPASPPMTATPEFAPPVSPEVAPPMPATPATPARPEMFATPEMAVEPTPLRSPNDGYAFAAIICALAGFVVPILPAAAALMLVRATEVPLADQPLSPGAARMASAAQTLAYISLTVVAILCAALLLGILGRTIS